MDGRLPTAWPFGSLPSRHYKTILADPPWAFRTWSKKNQTRAAENHYPVMSLDDIYGLPVGDLAADDCVLFLWSINPMLPQAITCIERWGFTYKTVAFTWAKQNKASPGWHMGLGYWSRQNTERVLLATRGKPKRIFRDVRELIISPRKEHSAKPSGVHIGIERLTHGPRVELFARERHYGWHAWGNEIPSGTETVGLLEGT